MRKNEKGYIYVNLLLVVLIALGFVLSGGFILSKRSSSTTKSAELYKLVEKEASSSSQTLQLSTLEFTPQVCGGGGYDIALVIDKSWSVLENIDKMLQDINSFVDSFSGKSTLFSVTKFSSSAEKLVSEFTDDFTMVKSKISSITSDGSTNWEDALVKAKETLDSSSNRPSFPDLVIFASDGEPNKSNSPGDELQTAVAVADVIKKNGARIVTVGIVGQDGINKEKLQAISGSTEGIPGTISTDVILTNWTNLGTDLQSIITKICEP